MCQTLGQISNVHPHTAACLQAPVPRSKGQVTGPTTPSFPPPREQRARVVIKPALPSAACPRMSPGKHRLRLRSHSSKGNGGRRQKRKERGALEATGIWTGLNWTGPATGIERGTNNPSGEDLSTSHKNQRFRSPKHLPILPDKWLYPALTHFQPP